MIVSWMRSLTATAPIGCAPLVRPLAIVMRSGVTPKLCAAKVCPVRPKPRDHLVEHQQDAVRVADLAQALEVALRRHEAAGGAGDRLDEAGGDVLRAVQVDDPHEVVGEFGAVRAFARREEVLLEVRVPHVGDARQARAELAPVVDEPRQRDAAEVDAVVGALARDEHVAPALAARLVVGERDLHRGVDGFGAGVGEEDAVEVARRQLGDARRELELLRVRAQERRAEVELAQLLADGVGDLRRPWPAETQNRPDDASMILSPRSFHRYIPSARTTICGSALNSRLGVNGIQYSSSEICLAAAWSWSVSSAWPIVVPPAVGRAAGHAGGAGRR